MRSPLQKCASILTVAGAIFATLAAKSAAQVVWTGAGSNNDWATGANWVGGTAPPSSSATWLEFDPALASSSNAGTPWEVNRIDFSEFFYITGSELSFLGTNPQINGTGQVANPIKIGAAGLNITAPPNRVVELVGIVSGTGPLIASGGYVSFGGAALNSYSGVVINPGATISFRYEGDLGTAPAIETDNIILDGGTAQFLYVSSLSSTRRILLNGIGTAVNAIRSFDLLTIFGEIRGSGALSVEGEVKLAGNNTYTGGTIVAGGTVISGRGSVLSVASSGALGGTGANVTIQNSGALSADYPIDQTLLNRVNPASTGAVTIGANSASSLDFQAAGLTNVRLGAAAGTWTYSGPLTPAAETYQFGGGGGRLVVTSVLSGTNQIEVSSSDNRHGRVELAAFNTYTGGSIVGVGGTLLTTASGSTGTGPVTVNAGGVFGGNGIAAGAVHIDSGGTLSPGIDGTGILTTGDLSFSGGTCILTLGGTVPGVSYDQIDVVGAVLLGNAPALSVTLAYDPAIGDSFTIIENDLFDTTTGRFAGLGEGTQFFLSSKKGGPLYPFEITYAGGTGNDVVVRVVPEPGVAANLLLASGMFASVVRLRRPVKSAVVCKVVGGK